MKKTITLNDLLLYSYSELPEEQHQRVALAIELDPDLRSAYQEIQLSKKALDSAMLSPADTVVQLILEESSSSALQLAN